MTTVTNTECMYWQYAPHRSLRNAIYKVPGETWFHTYYNKCPRERNPNIDNLIPSDLTDIIKEKRNEPVENIKNAIIDKIIKSIRTCKNILHLLLLHSCLINFYGFWKIRSKTTTRTPEAAVLRVAMEQTMIKEVYQYFYNEVEKLLVDKTHIKKIFIHPAILYVIGEKGIEIPKNVFFEKINNVNGIHTEATIISYYKINIIPRVNTTIDGTRGCRVELANECKEMFPSNEHTKDITDILACNCSVLNLKIDRIDTEHFKNAHILKTDTQCPVILIMKVPSTYLSQMFEKCCIVLYNPCICLPKTNSMNDILAAAKTNLDISKFKNDGSYMQHLSVFQTEFKTIQNPMLPPKESLPIHFVYENRSIKIGNYLDFLTHVITDLMYFNVFIKIDEYYELNTNFDIEVLDCYKNLAPETKSNELKLEITKYFYRFVGNLLHLIVANNVKVPSFKLSKVYIMQLFNTFDFTVPEVEIDDDTRMILITVYLLERKQQKIFSKIFENPKSIDESPSIRSALSKMRPSTSTVKMNGNGKIINSDRRLYSDDKDTLINNIKEYLYKTAMKSYFGVKNGERELFKIDPNIVEFFRGFKYTLDFRAPIENEKMMPNMNTSRINSYEKVITSRLAEIYFNGF